MKRLLIGLLVCCLSMNAVGKTFKERNCPGGSCKTPWYLVGKVPHSISIWYGWRYYTRYYRR